MSEPGPPPVLSLTGAAFRYPGGAGVAGLRFSVRPGEAVAVIGPNGAGKSTLLRGILGLVPLVEGELRFGDRTDAADGMIGFLPQSAEVDPDFPISLAQVVMQGRYRRLGLLRWPGRHDREVVRSVLETVGLAELANRRFGELSGGQRQRGLLARALASEPRLLLLDEPFNGLDQPNREALIDTLTTLKAGGVAVIVSTHDLELARTVCDTALLVNGEQVGCGRVDEVLTLENVQQCFDGVEVEIDEHTLVVPGHEGH
ncbi:MULTISPECIES: metal ABC transporter ATP-binding protein [Agromyces]|uniref:Metal ABC transporter ATP-binding protein n=1 Tax=Agromyces indicus TaxID=758919 RepID=A0ABU1FHD7_9MICO|nr:MULTISPECIES: metal ABC transporter ATP-binding protein [Agromyces]KZE95253.1 putative ABC transporter ATP-binding protein [Agromyces sp. NDB4Y10]MCK8610010.1 metal ABC transporter ATP-binding protein [Agromyces sp. C10]MDR5690705.1 metal ABC transporter ATP-binding protein [Agromyces indicus]